ncbi:unnamed protein product [Paramecium sonneborni]|uniref:Uncharacterized protein n=1 Tax=Paramecium sonneborni TaxID=65129 RepID=A0A8S1RF83_9CILI|nr:unnamed protein product [Paramecium sonneborni]
MNHNNIFHQYCLQRVPIIQPQQIYQNIPLYSKPIHPSNSHHMPMSYKNLDFKSLDSSETSQNSIFNDNQSCCCFQCGKSNKKLKSLSKQFIPFHTQMSVLRKIRMIKRFQNAVYCIIYLIQKRRKLKKKEKQKKMYRFKTKLNFDYSPLMPPQQQQLQSIQCDDKQYLQNHNLSSFQAKIIDNKLKQRQSIRVYLQQKLYEKDTQYALPKIHKITTNSFTNIQPLRFCKNEEQKSSHVSTQIKITPPQTEYSPTTFHNYSPYFRNITSRNQVDSIFQNSFSKTPRTMIKTHLKLTKASISLQKKYSNSIKGNFLIVYFVVTQQYFLNITFLLTQLHQFISNQNIFIINYNNNEQNSQIRIISISQQKTKFSISFNQKNIQQQTFQKIKLQMFRVWKYRVFLRQIKCFTSITIYKGSSLQKEEKKNAKKKRYLCYFFQFKYWRSQNNTLIINNNNKSKKAKTIIVTSQTQESIQKCKRLLTKDDQPINYEFFYNNELKYSKGIMDMSQYSQNSETALLSFIHITKSPSFAFNSYKNIINESRTSSSDEQNEKESNQKHLQLKTPQIKTKNISMHNRKVTEGIIHTNINKTVQQFVQSCTSIKMINTPKPQKQIQSPQINSKKESNKFSVYLLNSPTKALFEMKTQITFQKKKTLKK